MIISISRHNSGNMSNDLLQFDVIYNRSSRAKQGRLIWLHKLCFFDEIVRGSQFLNSEEVAQQYGLIVNCNIPLNIAIEMLVKVKSVVFGYIVASLLHLL